MADLQVVILAAGAGTRMKSSIPKVLQPLGGKALLLHVIAAAQKLQPQQIIVVVGHKREKVIAALPPGIKWVVQERQSGTGHALQTAAALLPPGGRTLVLYGDVPLIDAETLNRLLTAPENAVNVLTAVIAHPYGYGRIKRDEHGQITAIIEEKDATAAERQIQEINTGIYLLPNRHLCRWLGRLENNNAESAYYLTDVIGLAAAEGIKITTQSAPDNITVAGVNDKTQLAELERIYQTRLARSFTAAGLTLLDPARFDCRGELTFGQDVIIDVNVIFEGSNVLGSEVKIGANCYLKNVSIGDGAEIAPFCHLTDCTVGAGGRIGPYARLRPQSQLAAGVHIGNFVEIKKSNIGTDSKINHLSYVGDSDIGSKVNVGAGTVTCNYDGSSKHQTVIKDESFIGSGTMLVAPVTVEQGATVGAGSVITKNCPEKKLTLGRARQITFTGWSRPGKKDS